LLHFAVLYVTFGRSFLAAFHRKPTPFVFFLLINRTYKIFYEQNRTKRKGAIAGIESGMTVMFGGFGLCGIPENCIKAIAESGVTA